MKKISETNTEIATAPMEAIIGLLVRYESKNSSLGYNVKTYSFKDAPEIPAPEREIERAYSS